MTTLTGPLAVGEYLPTLSLISPAGRRTTWADERPTETSIVYFMRTSTCPVCHQHLRALAALSVHEVPAAERTVIVVPGGAAEAAAVEKRHPALAGRVFASEDAHENVGLFVTMGLQQSGTFVADPQGSVLYTKTATVPLGSFNERETIAALG